jgi:hypothetical protein
MVYTESFFFPPDVTMAAGPNNLLSASNGRVKVFTKSGTLQSSSTLNSFFGTSGSFDPWAVYDPYINRFWLFAVNQNDPSTSTYFIALSNTSDANGGFLFFALDARVFGSTVMNDWCDYPKLGIDAQAIYLTCNMFSLPNDNTSTFQTNKVRVMTKSQFVNNACCSWWDFSDISDGSGTAFTIQPAVMIGATNGNGEFLIAAQGGGGSGSVFEVYHITNAQNCCAPTQTGPGFAQAARSVGSYGAPPDAAQPSSALAIDTGDTRLLYAFWQNGKLASGQTFACGGPAVSCIAFDEFDVSAFPTITTLNDWFLPSAGHAYYPMVAANAAGNRTMVYSRSSSTEFAGARFVGIPPTTSCTGCFDGPETALHVGQNTYARNCFVPTPLGCSDARNRWGDYSGASRDPDGTGIWIRGEYASATQNQWATQIGLTYESGPPANDDFGNGITLSAILPANVTRATTGATTQLGEPRPCGAIGSTIWYNVTPSRTLLLQVDTFGSNYDTALAVYTGSSIASLSQVGCNDDSGSSSLGFLQSRLLFIAAGGTTYRIQVGGFFGSQGTAVLNIHALPILVTGADAGGGPHVRVFDALTGPEKFGFFAFNPAFTGGVRVAMGDVNGDGTPDIIVGPGPGGGPHVRVFDGATGTQLPGPVGSFFAFDPAFTGGVFVAAGDINGDGKADVIVGADAGGGPHVKVFDGATGAVLQSFFAFDPAFTGGVRVAATPVNSVGQEANIIVGAGPGGGPHVKVFDGTTLAVLRSFFAYSPGFTGGVYVAGGDVNGDGSADIITGAGAGGGPHVQAFSGMDGTVLQSFMAFGAGFAGGVRVAAGDVNGDGKADIATAAGPEGGPHVKIFDGATLGELASFFAYDPSFTGGVFVGAR